MSRKRLKSFTVDDASDEFVPTVKAIKTGNVTEETELDENQELNGNVNHKEEIKTGQRKLDVEGSNPPPNDEQNLDNSDTELPEKDFTEKLDDDEIEKKEKLQHNPIKIASDRNEVMASDKTLEIPISDEVSIADQTAETENESDEIVQLVGLFLGEEEFGIDIQNVQEIHRVVDITRVPRTPDYVKGVINLRGKVVPVISLRKRFGLTQIDSDNNARIMVVEVDGKIIGIFVDAVSEVLRIPTNLIEPPPSVVSGVDSDFIEAVCKLEDRILVLLDLRKLLALSTIDKAKQAA